MTSERPLVLPMPREDARVDARARLFVAAIVAPASLVLLSDPTPLRVVVGVAGLLASVVFVARSRPRSRLGNQADVDCLTLDAEALTLDAGGTRASAAYEDIETIDLEPDAATLVVHVRGREPIAIAPGYGGLGTIALHELLERHRHGADRSDRSYHGDHGR